MNGREISRVLAKFLQTLAAILLIPSGVAFLYEFILEKKIYFQTPATFAFLETIAICLLFAHLLHRCAKGSSLHLYRRESICVVAIIWLMTAAIGSLPFLLTGTIPDPLDAYFEAMSGLTTTGSTILEPKSYLDGHEILISRPNPLDPAVVYTFKGTVPPLLDPDSGTILKTGIEALGKPLLFWRAFLQWIGGMGIVLLFIAVLPALAMGGKFLFETEIAGPSKEGMTPRIKETASLLWKIYLALTLFEIGLLLITNANIGLFDAVALSFSTISTGGFAISNNGILEYQNGWTKGILALAMIAGSLNFTLYFYALKAKFYRLYDPELLFFGASLLAGSGLMSWNLWNALKGVSFIQAAGLGTFQAISAQTSTGLSAANYDLWPFSCQFLMLMLMYIGGMSGSTSGGIKIIRYAIVLKVIKNKVESLFRPESVRCLKVGQKEISTSTAMTVLTFFCIVISCVVLGTYLLNLDHNDPQTSFGIISCMLNNTGLAFGGIGSSGSFAYLSPLSKIISIAAMLLGRLEYFTLLVLLVPAFWRSR